MARERGLTVDTEGFEKLMEEQRARAAGRKRKARSRSRIGQHSPTHFLGYEHDHTGADVEAIFDVGEKKGVALYNSVLLRGNGRTGWRPGRMIGEEWSILENQDTRKSGDT